MLNKQDYSIIKIIADLKLEEEKKLTDQQEKAFQDALHPDAQFLDNVVKLFSKSNKKIDFS